MPEWGRVLVLMYCANTEEHLLGHESINVSSLSRKTLCVSSGKAEFQSHANLMTAPWAEFSSVFPIQKKMTLWKPWEKKMKPFQQLSLCFGCEKESCSITLKSRLVSDTHTHTALQRAGDPSSFSCAPFGTQHREKSCNCLTSELLIEEHGRDGTKQMTMIEKTRQWETLIFVCAIILLTVQYRHVWLMLQHNKLLLHKPGGQKEMSYIVCFTELVAIVHKCWHLIIKSIIYVTKIFDYSSNFLMIERQLLM